MTNLEDEKKWLVPSKSPLGSSNRVSDGSSSEGSSSDSEGEGGSSVPCYERVLLLLVDIVASSAFWGFMFFVNITYKQLYIFLGTLVASMIAWRVCRYKCLPPDCSLEVPYTTGYLKSDSKEMYLVATVHISPRAPRDVSYVIENVKPDVAMIELDDERLDRMRDRDLPAVKSKKSSSDLESGSSRSRSAEPDAAQAATATTANAAAAAKELPGLQAVRIQQSGRAEATVLAQRALWNAEHAREDFSGELVYDPKNAYGLGSSPQAEGKILVVKRASPNQEFAPFALKAHNAHRDGAKAVLVVNTTSSLPSNRVGGGSLFSDLKVACKTCNSGFPQVPLLILPKLEGEQLLADLEKKQRVSVSFNVNEDDYPRRTLRLRLCQACALVFSGIGILYGIIQCFHVEVGGEFLAAEETAHKMGIPCTCIDVDLNRFWSRLGSAVLPTPCNILNSLWAWLGMPRVVFQVLFPPPSNVDVFGGMFLHAASFPLKTWFAFLLAGFCASTVTSKILELFGTGAERAVEGTGKVTKEQRDDVQTYIMLAMEMYLLPQIYDAVAASRDEAMYRSVVRKSREMAANKFVVVVGAGHANGILKKARHSASD
eukprot:CAMPEP_0206600298 /NCGR_PEP_ID=MMETSP0325_2-20121206/45711_1 /ASSEMBLY_ACC=CAM_ASM_000347 /TAXON_ID=2866 /ORGANISM="Crypthecodinium cohnii, Strain Seligo" /LENGTH=599 /DNA_ID=CAMNT_0054111573 /DNA_START=30 /DNA_END=1827 /DNA_ORIENTATION=-